MKKFLAWVLSVFGAVNVVQLGIRVAVGNAPAMSQGLVSAIVVLFLWALFSLCFYLWWRWKQSPLRIAPSSS